MEFSFDTLELDTNAAIDGTIDESGAYVGEFKKVVVVKSRDKGTHGLKFTFESDEGGVIDTTLWVRSADGKDLFSAAQLAAMRVVLGAQKLVVADGLDDQWSAEEGRRVPTPCKVIANLTGKKIGLVLQKTTKDNPSRPEYPRVDYNVKGAYAPATRLTAGEIVKGVKEPKELDKILSKLKDIDNRKPQEHVAADLGLSGLNF